MNYGSKDKSRLLALILCVSLFAGCNGNSTIGPSNSLWTRCSGLPDLPVTGFASAGNVIVAGSYDALLSQAYIYISFDNGSSWSLDTTFQTDNHGSGTSSYLGTPVTFLSDGLYLFAGVVGGDSGNVYVSMNDGLTWVERDPSFVENIYCLAAMGKTIWAGTGHGVFVSTDHGVSWTSVNKGMPPPLAISGLVATGTYIFAATEGFGIYRSANGGTTWAKVNTTNLDFYSLVTIRSDIFAGYPGGYSNGGVLVSTDNGITWTSADVGLTDSSVNALCVEGSTLFAGTNAGVFLSRNSGGYWSDISTGTSVDSVATIALFSNASFLLAGTNGNGAWRYPVFLK